MKPTSRRTLIWVLLATALFAVWSFRPGNAPETPRARLHAIPPALISTLARVPSAPAGAEAATPAIQNVTQRRADRAEAFEEFRAWQARYRTAAGRAGLEAEGIALAQARRAAMARWIESDPEFALAQAVGPDARRELPAAVLAELERWVEGRGGLEVLSQFGPAVKPGEQTTRVVRVNGEKFQAFVYGRRLGQTTKYDLPIRGVAVDGKLALHSSPVRQLEPGEVQQRGLDPQAIHINSGGEVAFAAHAQAVQAIETKLLQREAVRGPYPAGKMAAGRVPAGLPPGTAAFPPSPIWTIGGKRLLVIRVDFPDDPGGPFVAPSGATITTNMIGSVMTSVNQFIVDNSQNLTSIETSMVPVVLRLPRTKAAYASSPADLLRDEALAAAVAYDLANGNTGLSNPALYDFDTVVCSQIDGAAWQFEGQALVGAKGMWANGKFEFRVLARELGHNYGLQSANRLDAAGSDPLTGTPVELGDQYDVMGANTGGQPLHFNEWFKAYLGWINFYNALGNSTVRLFRHDHPSASGTRAITLGQQGDRAYWLGYRRQHATNSFLNNGLEIRWGMQPATVNTNTGLLEMGITNDMSSAGSVLINTTPAVADFSQHPLPLNQTFYDSNNFVSITPVAMGGTAPAEFMDVNIRYDPPKIITQPQPLSVTASIGDTLSLSVDAVGILLLHYQWRFNSNSIAGETNSYLSLLITSTNQSGYYSVRITNRGGSNDSVNVLLNVLPPPLSPVIVLHPAPVTVPLGSNATFSVFAVGAQPLFYQWLFNGDPIPDATNTTLSLLNVAYGRVGLYSVIVSNFLGTATSRTALLDVTSVRPVAHWRFDEPPGSPVAMDSAGQINGTLSAAGSVFVPGGRVGNAISLDASASGHANMGDNFRFIAGSFTFVSWIKTAPGENRQDLHFIGKHDDASVNGYLFHANRGQNFFGQPNKATIDWGNPTNGTAVAVTSTTDVNDGNWHQVVAVHQPGGFTKMYVDGSPMEAQVPSRPMVTSSAPFLIGGHVVAGDPTGFFQGLVDDTQLYNRALTDSEIDYLFQNPGLEITGAPIIITPPQSINVAVGATGSFTPTLIGSAPFTYQWRFNGTNLPGATNLSLVLLNVQTNQGGPYSLRVDNALGFAISSSALLTVAQTPFIVQHPASRVVLASSNALFTVAVAGTPPFSYQWRFNGADIPGASAPSLTVSNTVLASAGIYSVRVTNMFGSVLSSNATLTVNSRPIITVQPPSRVASLASPVTFGISVVGNSPFAYQWRFNSASIPGATNPTYSIGGVVNAHTGLYSVLITNSFGVTLSADASLSTIPMRLFSPWGVTGGGTGTDVGTGVAVDAGGNAFVTGYFTGAAAFGTNQLTNAGGRDGFVAKYSAAGQLLWVRRFGGPGFDTLNAVAADTGGNCYLVGTFEGNATLGPVTFTNTSPSAYSDMAIAKLDANGTVLWSRTLGVESVNDNAHTIALDAAGNVLVAGQSVLDTFAGSALNNLGRVLVAKYDNAGNPLWARKGGSYSGGTYDVAQGVGTDAAGNVYLTGTFLSPVATFGAVSLANRGGSDAFLQKFDASGTAQWVQHIGGPKDDRANGMALDAAGNAYLAGEFLESLQLPGTNLLAGGTNLNLFVARFGPAGVLNWARQAGGVFRGAATSVSLDSGSQILLAGYIAGTATFGTNSLTSIAGTFDTFLTRMDTNGNFAFVQQAGGSDPGGDIALSVASDGAGNALVTGYFNNFGAFGHASAVSAGSEDFFLVRYNAYTGNPAPSLSIRPIGTKFRLSWPVASPGYLPQLAPDLRAQSWSDAFEVLGVEASEFAMTNQFTSTNRFFRLRRP
ncbi:MAG: hypothetical protein HZA92_06320 [Verrucomicrobia bacterium]|nr:hypothetical protein [Verrucomicrobiota bacterium]